MTVGLTGNIRIIALYYIFNTVIIYLSFPYISLQRKFIIKCLSIRIIFSRKDRILYCHKSFMTAEDVSLCENTQLS